MSKLNTICVVGLGYIGLPTAVVLASRGVSVIGVDVNNDVVTKINGEIVRMLRMPEVRERMAREGADPVGSTSEAFSKRLASEFAKWSKVVNDAGLTAN